jgi:hypothetical protein
MQYKFVKHTQVGKRFEERITITRARHVGFPTQFYEDNHIKDYKYAVLFYDKDNDAIGIKFTNENEPGAIAIARHSKGYGGYISATSFFKANRINTKKYAGRYDFKKVPLREVGFEEDGDLFVIELKAKERKEDE